MEHDVFVALLIGAAMFLLIFYKIIERFLDNKANEHNKRKEIATHAHSLVMDIGCILEDTHGVEQYNKLKPKLELVKRYYHNNDKRSIVPIDREKPTENEPVRLKVV